MTNAQRALLIAMILAVVLAVALAGSFLFTVNERDLAVVLRFGEPVASYTEPGLKWKLPLVDEVRRFPKTYQFWTGAGGEILVDLPTADGKKIEVTPWAIWRITDPEQFVTVVNTVEKAESFVQNYVRSEMRNVITSYPLAEVVRSTDRELTYTFQVEPPLVPVGAGAGDFSAGPPAGDEQGAEPGGAADEIAALRPPSADEKIEVGREQLVQQIKQDVQDRLSKTEQGEPIGRGIELVDVGIAKIDFVDAVRDAAFKRLIAFMESIAAKNEADGERAKMEIVNKANARVQQIEGQGKGESNKIRGDVEAQIIRMYADAIRQTGEFYNFVRTLEAYKAAVGTNTRLILTTDSDMFRLLKTVPPATEPAGGEAPAPTAPAQEVTPAATPEDPADRTGDDQLADPA